MVLDLAGGLMRGDGIDVVMLVVGPADFLCKHASRTSKRSSLEGSKDPKPQCGRQYCQEENNNVGGSNHVGCILHCEVMCEVQ